MKIQLLMQQETRRATLDISAVSRQKVEFSVEGSIGEVIASSINDEKCLFGSGTQGGLSYSFAVTEASRDELAAAGLLNSPPPVGAIIIVDGSFALKVRGNGTLSDGSMHLASMSEIGMPFSLYATIDPTEDPAMREARQICAAAEGLSIEDLDKWCDDNIGRRLWDCETDAASSSEYAALVAEAMCAHKHGDGLISATLKRYLLEREIPPQNDQGIQLLKTLYRDITSKYPLAQWDVETLNKLQSAAAFLGLPPPAGAMGMSQ